MHVGRRQSETALCSTPKLEKTLHGTQLQISPPRLARNAQVIQCRVVVKERGSSFDVEGRFYRLTSTTVRDLGILAACVLSRGRLNRPLKVLDACCGSGVRSLRYLKEAPVEFVWANDAQTNSAGVVSDNLASFVASGKAKITTSTLENIITEINKSENNSMEDTVSHKDSQMQAPEGVDAKLRFDLVDLDVFGACSVREIGLALDVINRSGGLLYLSSTDSVTAAGRNPDVARRAWEADPKWIPSVNEQFLRLVLGACAKAAAERELEIKPVFSYFHAASSTARLMIRVKNLKKSSAPSQKKQARQSHVIGHVGHCKQCGQNLTFDLSEPKGMSEVSLFSCSRCGATQDDAGQFIVSGPMWIGRLHNPDFCREMRSLSSRLHSNKNDWLNVRKIITQFITESAQPPQYYELGDIARRLRCSIPPRQRIADELARRRFTSSATHCKTKCIKTNAPYEELLSSVRAAANDVEAMIMAATSAEKQV